MRSLRVFADGVLVAGDVRDATRFFDRFKGLMWQLALEPGAGLLLQPGGSVHTFGMRFPIDVFFLDRDSIVLGVHERVAPKRVCFAPYGTRSTLELWAGARADAAIKLRQRLRFEDGGYRALP